MQYRALILSLLLLPIVNAQAAENSNKNDFPTLDRVEHVLACMKKRGAENYDVLYGCVCQIDYIASQFSHDEYNEAEVYRQLRRTPGERGGVFRDPDQADKLRERLTETLATSEKRCFFKNISATDKK